MASQDPENIVLEPERRVAARIVERRKLVPPIDIQSLVSEYADVELVEFGLPASIDAIVITRNGSRPRIIAERSVHMRRLRFTLSHELGHIRLPWQMGTIFSCHTQYSRIVGLASHELYGKVETEANRFASELLLPTKWLLSKVNNIGVSGNKQNLSDFIAQISSEAQVSLQASVIAIKRFLGDSRFILLNRDGQIEFSDGSYTSNVGNLFTSSNEQPSFQYNTAIIGKRILISLDFFSRNVVVVILNQKDVIIYSTASRDNFMTVPTVGQKFSSDLVDTEICKCDSLTVGVNTILIFYPKTDFNPIFSRPTLTSKEILAEIMSSLDLSSELQRSIGYTLSGMIGYANSAHITKESVEPDVRGLWMILRLRLRAIPGMSGDIAQVLSHVKFEEYLLARSFELVEKRRTAQLKFLTSRSLK